MKTVKSEAVLRALALRQGGTVSLGGSRFNTTGLRALPSSEQTPAPAVAALRESVSGANIEPAPPQVAQLSLGADLTALLTRALSALAPEPVAAPVQARPRGWSFNVIRNDAGRIERMDATPTF